MLYSIYIKLCLNFPPNLLSQEVALFLEMYVNVYDTLSYFNLNSLYLINAKCDMKWLGSHKAQIILQSKPRIIIKIALGLKLETKIDFK